MNEKQILELNDDVILDYYISQITDDEYKSVVIMLKMATKDNRTAASFIRKSIKTGKKFSAVYAGIGEEPHEGSEYIGSIPDGSLYLT
jgi:hypothetical protein